MSVHIFIFGPTPFVESLVRLSQSEDLLTQVGTDFEDSDADFYDQLNTFIEAVKSNEEGRSCRFLILTPQFGDRYTTIALSIPIQELYVISGVNVQTLFLLHTHPSIVKMYQSRQIKAPSLAKQDPVEANKYPPLAIEYLAEKLCENSKLGVIFHEQYLREEGEESNIDASILETDFSQFL